MLGYSFVTLALACIALAQSSIVIPYGNPYLYLNGRWDETDTSWWTGTGFKLVAKNLKEMTVYLGALTSQPASVGVSVNYGAWQTVNLTAGANAVPLDGLNSSPLSTNVIRVANEGWQNNNIQLEAVEINGDAVPEVYTPSPVNFQFIGDSLSAGQYCVQGVINAWNFVTAENFKAEHSIQAQPGVCLTDIECWGNIHGQSYEFFQAEDDGYYNDAKHNYTTPWNFARDLPATHVVIHIGANDASTQYNISEPSFLSTYETFVTELRVLYPTQPFFIFTPWGWPAPDGTVGYYYTSPSPYVQLIENRNALGDYNIFLVNTTGWVSWADVFPTNQHPTEEGHVKIAAQFSTWLTEWGLFPQTSWATPAV
ncbi:hypothetical protein CALCODRAFT_491191 [Calocera cornea HHB12733]|uniref:SGNH hydrolase-type esterase domain-containing protein n=1 Tax=Calocera cornea HHB12733 TaxID=1353952 RepID=A0A165J557_9BASI|nr:hypothetical protein CALCODRAFT_491191 [Calocera cornea HHB12733]